MLIQDTVRNVNTIYNIVKLILYLILLSSASYDTDLLILSMKEIENNTCVTFVPRTSQVDYIEIYSGNGCSSSVGRQGGKQTVSLMTSLGTSFNNKVKFN